MRISERHLTPGNFREGERCWLCDGPSEQWPTLLKPTDQLLTNPRYGAFLRTIPPIRRIGDYVHCTSRVVNILLKRLLNQFVNPRDAAPLKDLLHSLSQDAQRLPIAQRLAPRKSKPGTLDLTASRLFVDNLEAHAIVVRCASTCTQTFTMGSGKIGLGPAIQLLLSCLFTLHRLWRQKTVFTPIDLDVYLNAVSKFGLIWHALQWNLVIIFIPNFQSLFFSFSP